jgi:small subunit ribosomal protein S1
MNVENDKGSPDGTDASMEQALNREVEAALSDGSLMDMMDAEEMAARSDNETIRKGTVVAVQGDDIFVDVGAKSEGYLPTSQFPDGEIPEVGTVVEVVIAGYDDDDGILRLSREGAVQAATWQNMKKGQILEGRVTGHNKGGLELDFSGVKGFMPASQIDRFRVEEMSGYVNEKLQCEVVEIRRKGKDRSIVVSRRNLLAREAEANREKAFAELAPGNVVPGVVKTIMPYGAFIDIGGIDGLLHVKDMAHSRVDDPKTVVTEGQKVEVMILKIDPETRKFGLGLKQTLPDPWSDAAQQWQSDTIVTGRVVKLMDFGAFVELAPGVEGLIPISEMSYARRINHPKELLSEGETTKVRVLNVDLDRKRISLSIKRLEDDPWSGASVRWPTDSRTTGTVKRLEGFGAFVELVPGVEGLIHISELSHNRVNQVSEVLSEGQQIEVVVLSTDEDKHRISLSMKRLQESPEYDGDLTEGYVSAPSAPEQSRRKKKLRGGLER